MPLVFSDGLWALVLGGSSGFGLSTAKKLARHGMNLAIVHRDRRGAMERIAREFAELESTGVEVRTFNVDALDEASRKRVLDELTAALGAHGKVRLLLHSLAFGNLKLLAPLPPGYLERAKQCRARLADVLGSSEAKLSETARELFGGPGGDPLSELMDPPAYGEHLLSEEDFARTVSAMGTSLATWTMAVFSRGLFAESARVIGLSSEGSERVFRGYAAVAAAKSAMESVARALAVELGPYGVLTNIVQAGVTDTPALAHIPGNAHMKARARLRNPLGRLTRPEDVADFIALLCCDEAAWVNGAILCVDGGERIHA